MTPLDALRLLSPAAHRCIEPWLDRNLDDYLVELWRGPRTAAPWLAPASPVLPSPTGRALFLDELTATLAAQGHHQRTIDAVRAQLDQVPIVQTADHTQLVLDPVMFANHVSTLIGAWRGDHPYVIVLGSSTNTFTSATRHGPALLAAGEDTLNVFGLTNRARRNSVYAHPDPVRFAFTAMGTAQPRTAGVAGMLRELLGADEHPSAADAYRVANERIWQRFGFADIATLIQLDSAFSARLVARHIRLGAGPVHDLLFADEDRTRFLRERAAIGRDPRLGGFLRHQTDLVWGVAHGRIRSVRLVEGMLRDPEGAVAVRYQPEEVAAALDVGLLAPDVCLTFLTANLLPDFGTLGGPSQLVYVPLLWELAGPSGATALIQGLVDIDSPVDLLDTGLSRGWLDELSQRTLLDTMGPMRAFSYLVGMAADNSASTA